MLLELCLLVLGLFVYYVCYKPFRYWQEREVKCSKGVLPIVGNTFSVIVRRQSFFEFLQHIYMEYPKDRYNGFYQFGRPQLLVRDLELMKQIFIKDFDHFVDHFNFVSEEADPVFSKILFALSGERWRQMRATLSPAFTSSKMRGMFVLMSECSEDFANFYFEKKEEVVEDEMKEVFSKLANDVIASTAFGVKCDSLRNPENEFYKMGRVATGLDGFQRLRTSLFFLAPGVMKRLKLSIFPKHVIDFFVRTVTNNIEQREKKGIVRPDVIHLLMEARKGKLKHENLTTDASAGFATVEESDIGKTEINKKIELTDEMVTAQALLFFFAGFDAISSLASFVAYELAVNPDVQKKLQREIDNVLVECKGKLTYDALMRMKYLDQVVSEVLRIWAPGFQIERLCVKDYDVEPVKPEEKKLVIEKGTSVIVSVVGIHRDPEYYPNPMKFDPERFSDENKEKIIPGTYLPFGSGPRNCIGSRFALLETKTLIFYMLSKLDIVVTKKTQIPLKISKSNPNVAGEKGIWLGFKKRTEIAI